MCQGFRALAAQGQDFHQLPVGAFPQIIDLQLPLGIGAPLLVGLLLHMHGGQCVQGIQRLAAQRLAFEGGPLFEGVAVFQVEIGQEIAAVELRSFCQGSLALRAGQQSRVLVSQRVRKMGGKTVDIHLVAGCRINLHPAPVGEQERHAFAAIHRIPRLHLRDSLAQVVNDLAQVGAGRLFGHIRPQEGHQGAALMGAVMLHRQINEQRLDLFCAQSGQGLFTERAQKRAQ